MLLTSACCELKSERSKIIGYYLTVISQSLTGKIVREEYVQYKMIVLEKSEHKANYINYRPSFVMNKNITADRSNCYIRCS